METIQKPETGESGLGPVAVARFRTAFIHAVLLCLLAISHDRHFWPATQPGLFAAIFLVVTFAPLIVIQAVGQIPSRRLAVWAGSVAVIAGIVGSHDLLRRGPRPILVDEIENVLPFPTGVFFAAGLFIAHALMTAAYIDRRRIASYATYFDVAWKQGVQVVAAAGFTAVFWIVMHLGAALFGLVKLDFLSRLIAHAWFAFPATAIAVTAAIHVTDVRPQIIRSIKSLILTLLSWLLPLATLIAAGFLLSLPMTGLAPLWATKSATPILLGCAAGLIVLLNAAYQDGAPERAAPVPLRAVGTLAAALLFPMVAIAGYGVALRVGQYGWTNDRIIAAACILVAACYAVGYLWAVRAWRGWLKPLEHCNIITSFVALGVLLALFTPIADPARIATASQLERLNTGAVAPAQFDFISLRFDNERYGYEAIQRLAADATAAAATKAEAARVLAMTFKRDRARVDLAAIADSLKVSPAGAHLPESFLKQDWTAAGDGALVLADCQKPRGGPRCDAVMVDLTGDGTDEIVLFSQGYSGQVFAEKTGVWAVIATLPNGAACANLREILSQGRFEVAPAAWKDLVVNGVRIPLVPNDRDCPK